MPNFLCKNCGATNLVPADDEKFTCKICGEEQDTPALNEQIENDSLMNSFLDAPEDAEVDNSVLDYVFDSPDKRLASPNEVFNRLTFSENVKVYEDDFKDEERDEESYKNGIYYTALSKMGGENPLLYYEALKGFEAIRGWKDSEELIEECKAIIPKLEKQEESQKKESEYREKRRKQMFAIGIPFSVLAIVGILISVLVLIPNSRYSKALEYQKNGDVISAYESFVSLNGYKDSEQKASELFDEYKQKKIYFAGVGETVYFGSYNQDNDKSNGNEDIAWLVLEKKDDSLLLLSVYGLDSQRYNENAQAVNWETSTVRKWLNDDFYNAAFNENQRKKIINSVCPADSNPNYDTDPGKDTIDKVFLLSISEAKKYLLSAEQLRCVPTLYTTYRAVALGANNYSGGRSSTWFLRTPGQDETMAAYVSSDGIIRQVGYSVDLDIVAIRPAIRVNIELPKQ